MIDTPVSDFYDNLQIWLGLSYVIQKDLLWSKAWNGKELKFLDLPR